MNNLPNEEALFELLMLRCNIDKYGTKRYINGEGKLHRMHGPAVIFRNGAEIWYKNGYWHREDGPALIYSSGSKEYHVNGDRLTEKEFFQWQKDNGIISNE